MTMHPTAAERFPALTAKCAAMTTVELVSLLCASAVDATAISGVTFAVALQLLASRLTQEEFCAVCNRVRAEVQAKAPPAA